jgi:hypothetical protein
MDNGKSVIFLPPLRERWALALDGGHAKEDIGPKGPIKIEFKGLPIEIGYEEGGGGCSFVGYHDPHVHIVLKVGDFHMECKEHYRPKEFSIFNGRRIFGEEKEAHYRIKTPVGTILLIPRESLWDKYWTYTKGPKWKYEKNCTEYFLVLGAEESEAKHFAKLYGN